MLRHESAFEGFQRARFPRKRNTLLVDASMARSIVNAVADSICGEAFKAEGT